MISLKIFIYLLLVNFIQCYLNPYPRTQQQQQQNFNNCPLRCPQQSPPPSAQSCPCMKAKNSTKCFAWDSRLQATSLDEAMFSFPDITDYSPNPPTLIPPSAIVHTTPRIQNFVSNAKIASADSAAAPSLSAASASGGSGTCNSKQCEACRMHVLAGFSQALNASSQFNKRTGHGAFTECPYVQIKQKEKEAQKEKLSRINSQNDHTVNQMVNLLKQAQQKKKRDVSNNGINDEDNNGLSSVDQNDLKEKLLGVSTKISCDYIRGEALNSDSPWCGLCNICWTWRKLPPNYFPSYLNEVSCDSDNACLGGFGKCRSVLRTLTVLRNTAKDSTAENWEQQSINTIAACECQVEAGTPLHSFIIR